MMGFEEAAPARGERATTWLGTREVALETRQRVQFALDTFLETSILDSATRDTRLDFGDEAARCRLFGAAR
jgi:hypothetical protein